MGFMKALKSKAMKIGQVLESIARLFSGPERLSLLRRYKVLSIIVQVSVAACSKFSLSSSISFLPSRFLWPLTLDAKVQC